MELPLTREKFIEMTAEIRAQRETALEREVRGGVARAEFILNRLKEEVQEAIEKKSGRTHFSYPLVSYHRIHERFGKEDVEKAALKMGQEYMAKYFPAANAITIDYGISVYGPLSYEMIVNIHFNLPSPSSQTSSHLGQPK